MSSDAISRPHPSETSSSSQQAIKDVQPSSKSGSDGPGSPISQPKLPRRITKTNTLDSRRPGLVRIPSVQTRYMDMLLSQDTIPRIHNILASFFQWILLAGYLVLPATFNSIQNSVTVQTSSENGNVAARTALAAVKFVPLLYVGAFCTGLGLAGKAWLFYCHSKNYVWLVNKILMPGFMNSSAGLISTLVGIYASQKGTMSITAKVTLCVTGGLTGLFLIMFALYNFWALKRVKDRHDDELRRDVERDKSEEHEHEGALEKVKRIIHEPALEPSSVI